MLVYTEESLITLLHKDEDFASNSVLNENETISEANISIVQKVKQNSVRRKKSQIMAKRSVKKYQ